MLPVGTKEFQVGSLKLKAKHWSRPGKQPTLALHGWMDNCASFDFLAPLLPERDILSLDLAGHGQSDNRDHMGAYNIWQDVAELSEVANVMAWDSFDIIGHSRGAMIAFLFAGTFPDRVRQLHLIEGIFPYTDTADQAPATLAQAIAGVQAAVRRPIHYYNSFDDAVKARVKGLFAIEVADAEALATWGVEKCGQGYRWRYDHKLAAGSEIRLGEDQLRAFARNITCPTQLILAESGLKDTDKLLEHLLPQVSNLSTATLTGGHHLHMSQSCSEVAEAINSKT